MCQAPFTPSRVRFAARRLQRSLSVRGVLCDVHSPCVVDVRGDVVHVTLPSTMANTRLCEPYGPRNLQVGLAVRTFTSTINITQLIRWACAIRRRHSQQPVFLNGADDPRLRALLRRKPPPAIYQRGRFHAMDTHAPGVHNATKQHVTALSALLNATRAGTGPPLRVQSLGRCAVVGSGFDLLCGRAVGSEIDGHDAVFRSNAAQMVATAGMRAPLRAWLRQSLGDVARVGARTTYRVNGLVRNTYPGLAARPMLAPSAEALHQGAGGQPFQIGAGGGASREVCVVSEAWWRKSWSAEEFNNAPQACCQRPAFSNYSTSRLNDLVVRRGLVLAFAATSAALEDAGTDGELTRGVAGLASLSESSGGNALLSAIAACRHVALYGSGLLRLRDEGELVYAHFYDAGAGRCASAESEGTSCNGARCQEARERWRRDRLETEVLLHALHALGVVEWQWAS